MKNTFLLAVTVALSVQLIPFKAQCQVKYDPPILKSRESFYPKDPAANRLDNFLYYKFMQRYNVNYFAKCCGRASELAKFQIDEAGKVINLTFDNPPSILTKFIAETIQASEWSPAMESGRAVKSKIIALPVYIDYRKTCFDTVPPTPKTYFPANLKKTSKPIPYDGYQVQKEDAKEIVCWPVIITQPVS